MSSDNAPSPFGSRIATAFYNHVVVTLVRNWRLSGAVERFLESWEKIMSDMNEGPTKTCHSTVVRLARGQVRAWRTWLKLRYKNNRYDSKPKQTEEVTK